MKTSLLCFWPMKQMSDNIQNSKSQTNHLSKHYSLCLSSLYLLSYFIGLSCPRYRSFTPSCFIALVMALSLSITFKSLTTILSFMGIVKSYYLMILLNTDPHISQTYKHFKPQTSKLVRSNKISHRNHIDDAIVCDANTSTIVTKL